MRAHLRRLDLPGGPVVAEVGGSRLARVVPTPELGEPWPLVAWGVTSGEVALVATGDAGTRLVAVAEGLLAR